MMLSAGCLSGCLGQSPSLGGGGRSTGDSGSGTNGAESAEPDSSGGIEQTPLCAEYLQCVQGEDPSALPEAEARYGVDGPCWANPNYAGQCDEECLEGLVALCSEDSDGGTGEQALLCSLDALLPGATSPVESGLSAEQLPESVGRILEDNCGCHYVSADEVDRSVPVYLGPMPMSTWSDFQAPFGGQTVWQEVRQRAIVELGMPPAYFCDDLAIGSLSVDDHTLLSAWLDEGAPDAPTFAGRDSNQTDTPEKKR